MTSILCLLPFETVCSLICWLTMVLFKFSQVMWPSSSSNCKPKNHISLIPIVEMTCSNKYFPVEVVRTVNSISSFIDETNTDYNLLSNILTFDRIFVRVTRKFDPVLWLENYFQRDYNHRWADLPVTSFDFGTYLVWYQYHQSLHLCHFRLQNSSSRVTLWSLLQTNKILPFWFENQNCKWKIKDNLFIEPEKSISSKR